jgi:hypothetical protein
MKKYLFILIIAMVLVTACSRQDILNKINDQDNVEFGVEENGQINNVQVPVEQIDPAEVVVVTSPSDESAIIITDGRKYIVE